MVRTDWSDRARADLDVIILSAAQDSVTYAENLYRRIMEATDNLVDFPRLGRVVPEIGRADYRELFAFNYRIIYQIIEGEVWITRIVHGRQQFRISDIML